MDNPPERQLLNLISTCKIIIFWGLSRRACYKMIEDNTQDFISINSMREISKIKSGVDVIFKIPITNPRDLNSIVFEKRIRSYTVDQDRKVILVMNPTEYHEFWSRCQPIINSDFGIIEVPESYSGENNPKYLKF